MSDLFKCDHCQNVFPKVEKAGIITLEQCRWGANGISFPNYKMHVHDLCKSCFSIVIDLANRKSLPTETAIVKVIEPKRTSFPRKIPLTLKEATDLFNQWMGRPRT